MSCKHHMVDRLTKHCVNCCKSLVEIDKEIRDKNGGDMGEKIKPK